MLSCPRAKYTAGMKINCDKTADRCGHQYYRRCMGWWVLSETAKHCPLREEARQDEQGETGAGRGNGL